jgi:GTP-binding protein
LLFVLDAAGSESRHPVQDLENLRREIDLFDPRLSVRPWYVIANKMDLPGFADHLAELRARFPNAEVLAISAAQGEGIGQMKEKLAAWLKSGTDLEVKAPAEMH